MKKILVPSDFSPCAEKALLFAAGIARRAQAELVVLHASNELIPNKPEGERELIETYNGPIRHNAKARLEAVEQQVRQMGEVNVSTLLFDGDLGASIQHAIDGHKIDLIVMGTQGATGLIKKIMGSHTAETISNVDVPVIAIPAQYEGTTIRNILLALKNTEEDLQCLAPVFTLKHLFDADISLAIFSEDKSEAVDYIGDRRSITTLQQRLQDLYGLHLEVVHLTGSSFEETMQQHIEASGVDLLVMITYKRGGIIESLFNRSITRRMAYHTTIPLLSLRK